MEDEHQDHPPETSATPVSNQNLIIGIVMGAVVLLLLLLVISQQFGDIGDSGNSELADMRRKLEEAREELADKECEIKELHSGPLFSFSVSVCTCLTFLALCSLFSAA